MIYKAIKDWWKQSQRIFWDAPVVDVQESEMGMKIAFQTDKAALGRFHREVLKKCFHKYDLDSARQLIANVKSGDYVVALVEEGDEILGGIVIEHSWSMGKKVMLIAWVAVSKNHRGRDIGTLLVNQAISYAKANEALILLGEVENPEEFEEEDPAYGDPAKRVKFYSRFDCQRLEVPYVVKMYNGDEEFGMMLTLFPLSEEQVTATEISSPELSLFVKEFVEMDETESAEILIESANGTVQMTPYRKLYGS